MMICQCDLQSVARTSRLRLDAPELITNPRSLFGVASSRLMFCLSRSHCRHAVEEHEVVVHYLNGKRHHVEG